MTNEDKIIKYLDGQLNSEEKTSFEYEVEKSEILKREFEKYLLVKKKIEAQKRVELSGDYTDSILPEFHSRLSGIRSMTLRKKISYAFSAMLILVTGVVVIRLFNNNSNSISDVEKFTQSLNEEQKINLLEDLSSTDEIYSMISGKELIGILERNLAINSEVLDNYNISYQDILGSLTNTEADKIYNEILKQNILKEVPL